MLIYSWLWIHEAFVWRTFRQSPYNCKWHILLIKSEIMWSNDYRQCCALIGFNFHLSGRVKMVYLSQLNNTFKKLPISNWCFSNYVIYRNEQIWPNIKGQYELLDPKIADFSHYRPCKFCIVWVVQFAFTICYMSIVPISTGLLHRHWGKNMLVAQCQAISLQSHYDQDCSASRNMATLSIRDRRNFCHHVLVCGH